MYAYMLLAFFFCIFFLFGAMFNGYLSVTKFCVYLFFKIFSFISKMHCVYFMKRFPCIFQVIKWHYFIAYQVFLDTTYRIVPSKLRRSNIVIVRKISFILPQYYSYIWQCLCILQVLFSVSILWYRVEIISSVFLQIFITAIKDFKKICRTSVLLPKLHLEIFVFCSAYGCFLSNVYK